MTTILDKIYCQNAEKVYFTPFPNSNVEGSTILEEGFKGSRIVENHLLTNILSEIVTHQEELGRWRLYQVVQRKGRGAYEAPLPIHLVPYHPR